MIKKIFLKKKKIIIALTVFFFCYKLFFIISNKFFPQKIEQKHIKLKVIEMHSSKNKATIIGYGNFSTGTKTSIFSEASSDVDKILINGHSKVKKGQIIMKLKERAIVDTFYNIEANYENASKQYAASEEMLKRNLISESDFRNIKAQYEMAKSNWKKASLGKNNLDVKAPFDGTLVEVFVNEGQYVEGKDAQAGKTPLYSIVKDDKCFISVPIQGKYINKIYRNQKIDIVCDENIIKGYIKSFEKTIDPKTGYFSIVALPDNNNNIINGESCVVKIYYDIDNSFEIPSDILVINNEQLGLKVINDNKFVFRPIKILSDENAKMIVKGAEDKDLLIVSGNDFVKEYKEVNSNFIVEKII